MGDRVVFSEVDSNHIFFGIAYGLVYSECCVARFTQTNSNLAFFVADDERHGEGEAAAAGDCAGYAAYGNHLLVVLALGAGRAVR